MTTLKQKLTAGIAGIVFALNMGLSNAQASQQPSLKPIVVKSKQEALQRYDKKQTVEWVYKHFTLEEANLVLQYLDGMNDKYGLGELMQSTYDGRLSTYSSKEKKRMLNMLKGDSIERRLEYNQQYNAIETESGNLTDTVQSAIGTLEEIKSNQVSLEEVVNSIKKGNIVYFGVDHYNKFAHDTIGIITQKLARKGYEINVFMETDFKKHRKFTDAEKKLIKRAKGQGINLILMPLHGDADEKELYHTLNPSDFYGKDKSMADVLKKHYSSDKINLLVNGMSHTIFDERLPSFITANGKEHLRIIFAYQPFVEAHHYA